MCPTFISTMIRTISFIQELLNKYFEWIFYLEILKSKLISKNKTIHLILASYSLFSCSLIFPNNQILTSLLFLICKPCHILFFSYIACSPQPSPCLYPQLQYINLQVRETKIYMHFQLFTRLNLTKRKYHYYWHPNLLCCSSKSISHYPSRVFQNLVLNQIPLSISFLPILGR